MNPNFIQCWRRRLRKAAYRKNYRDKKVYSAADSLREVFIILNSSTGFRKR